MALYHKWDVKNDFAYVLQFFSLISDGLGGVQDFIRKTLMATQKVNWIESSRKIGHVLSKTVEASTLWQSKYELTQPSGR